MPTISAQLPNQFQYEYQSRQYRIRDVVLSQDLKLLHQWMHQTHVIPQWQLNQSMMALAVHFEKMSVDDHQRLYIIEIDQKNAGYLEIYEAKRDRLSLYYDADPHDMGWHILLAEDMVGQGHFKAVMQMMCQYVFQHSPAKKIVGEPDVQVKSYRLVQDQIAFEPQKIIEMPEKQAILYHCYREKFLKKHPFINYTSVESIKEANH